MGYFCDYFRAPDTAAALEAAALTARGTSPADAIEAKGLDPAVIFGQLVAFVRGVEWTPDIPDLDFVSSDGDGTPGTTVRIDDVSRDALADLDPARVGEVAGLWAGIEELDGDLEPDELAPLVVEFSALARRARTAGDHLYCWISI
ncbi:hypothetical protein GCM10009557_38970 [Virgisporangium ochraceum]|uniref:DUF1877 family protein n=1 Tax=Virgisporangium ochraceum TaxID=65505 RepID=A0A8J4A2S7_9ACTN|nr:hypothetical protein [Virgisporangium ochraceum]GIJ74792.1 hypothetical protein Voc01_097090 [Virgisporangium ochraceum]